MTLTICGYVECEWLRPRDPLFRGSEKGKQESIVVNKSFDQVLFRPAMGVSNIPLPSLSFERQVLRYSSTFRFSITFP